MATIMYDKTSLGYNSHNLTAAKSYAVTAHVPIAISTRNLLKNLSSNVCNILPIIQNPEVHALPQSTTWTQSAKRSILITMLRYYCLVGVNLQNTKQKKYPGEISWNHSFWTHFLKCSLTVDLCLKSLPHKPQQNCLNTEWTDWCSFNSAEVQKRFSHLLQTNVFTPSCRIRCCLRSLLKPNFFWQMLQVDQVPSLCDFSRCRLRCLSCAKCCEQCLHEYGFAPVWIRTWRFRVFDLNSFPQ